VTGVVPSPVPPRAARAPEGPVEPAAGGPDARPGRSRGAGRTRPPQSVRPAWPDAPRRLRARAGRAPPRHGPLLAPPPPRPARLRAGAGFPPPRPLVPVRDGRVGPLAPRMGRRMTAGMTGRARRRMRRDRRMRQARRPRPTGRAAPRHLVLQLRSLLPHLVQL